ncbi:MAG: hypothetical protein U9N51_11785 [Bacteroidota bacterium]|nr:hypothetical protein [Bacteroidota bacterium]
MKKIKLTSTLLALLAFSVLSAQIAKTNFYQEQKAEKEVSVYPELDEFLYSKYYQSLPEDSAYKPDMRLVPFTDERVAHVIDKAGNPINPLNNKRTELKTKNNTQKTKSLIRTLNPASINFVEIQNKIYYRFRG